ncbi:MAG: hypothetical protein QM296_01655 [Bacillota bacterium]|nr:hypothetical protein [Bacillota bacterium]
MNLPCQQALPLALVIPYEAYMLGLVLGIAVLLLIVIILLVQTKQALIAKPETTPQVFTPHPAPSQQTAPVAGIGTELIAVLAAAIAAADEDLYASADDVIITGVTPLAPAAAAVPVTVNWDAPSTAGFRVRPRLRV